MILHNKRILLALSLSFAFHVLVLFFVPIDDNASKTAPSWVPLELIARGEVLEKKAPAAPEATPAPLLTAPTELSTKTKKRTAPSKRISASKQSDEPGDVPVELPTVPQHGANFGIDIGVGADADDGNEENRGTPGGSGAGAGDDDGATAPNKITLPRDLRFSDFERLMGKTAEKERNDYQEKKRTARRNRAAFVSDTKRIREALAKQQSITKRAITLELGENRDQAAKYLLSLHNRMAPHFSHFLTSLDSPFEQMHKKIQQGPLKYNPFYLPPPEQVRQDSMSGPLADLTLKTLTEFEILPTGELGEIRMILSSKNEAFDAAAIDTLLKSAPFAPPPKMLISMNERAHVQWTFFRDWKKNSPKKGRVLLLTSGAETIGGTMDAGDLKDD